MKVTEPVEASGMAMTIAVVNSEKRSPCMRGVGVAPAPVATGLSRKKRTDNAQQQVLMSRVLGDELQTDAPYHNKCDTLENPHCSTVNSAEYTCTSNI